MKNRIILKFVTIFVLLSITFYLYGNNKDEKTGVISSISKFWGSIFNDENKAKKVMKKNYRSVTVIVRLDNAVVKECILSTSNGKIVDRKNDAKQTTVVFENFDKSNVFINESEFMITLIDRYDMKYEKTFFVNAKGNTDVTIDKSDYVKQSGDWIRHIEKRINE